MGSCSVGKNPAMAGRVMPGMVRSCNFAIAIKAPVLPADTMALARLAATSAMASHIELSRPRRTACEAVSFDETANSV